MTAGTVPDDIYHNGNWYDRDGSQYQIDVNNLSALAEQYQQTFTFSGITAAALGQTSNIAAYGFPFQILVLTKSSTTDSPIVYLGINGKGVIALSIASLSSETIAITALIDGTNASAALGFKKSDGTFATALGNGFWTFGGY